MLPQKWWSAVRSVSTTGGRSRQGRPCDCGDGSNGWEIGARHSAFKPTMRTKSSARPLSHWWPHSGHIWSRASRQRFWHSNALEPKREALHHVRSADHHSACCLNVMRAVPSKSCGHAAVTMAAHQGPSRVRFLSRHKCRSAGQRRCGGTVPSDLFVGRHGPGLRLGACRNAVAAVTVLGPCVLSLQDHTHSGLVFVVNPGSGTAALHFVCVASCLFTATVRPDKFPLRCADSSRGKFLGPAGPPRCCGLRCGAPGALPDRITPRPRWARTWKPRKESS